MSIRNSLLSSRSVSKIGLSSLSYNQYVIVLLVVWGIADTASTYMAIMGTGTVSHEANPLIRSFLEIHVAMLIPVKLVAITCVGIIAFWGKNHIIELPYWQIYYILCIVVGTVVTAMNTSVAVIAVL